MSEWATAKLGELCTKVGSGATPRGGKEAYKASGISLIRSQNVYNNRFEKEGLAFIDKEQAASLSNVEVKPNDVLLNITGDSVARACQVADNVLPARVNQHVAIVRPDPGRLNPGYLRYWLVSPRTQAIMLSLASAGATRKALTKGMIEGFEIPLPKIETQRRIAHILGTLDDKIELNRRMNRTLEAIARAIFKSWFIDFDPVIDNAILNGKPIPDEFAKRAEVRRKILARSNGGEGAVDYHRLFSDEFQDSPLGKIPEGWEVKPLSEICVDVVRGVTPKYEDGSGRFIINQRVNRGFTLDLSSLKELSGGLPVPGEKMAKAFDVLVNSLGEGTIGRIHFFRGAPDVYAIDQHMTICRCLHPGTSSFVYQYLASPEGQYRLQALKSGSTTMTMLNISKLRAFEIAIPGRALLDTYWQAVSPLWSATASSERQGVSLSACRDALLPQLLSGSLTDGVKFIPKEEVDS